MWIWLVMVLVILLSLGMAIKPIRDVLLPLAGVIGLAFGVMLAVLIACLPYILVAVFLLLLAHWGWTGHVTWHH